MTRSYKILGFLLVTMLGAYGCAKGPGSPATDATPNPAAAKVQKLEDDYRGAIAAREQLRQKLAAAEEEAKKTKLQLERLEATRTAVAAERDALKGEVKTRTTERDAVQAQYEGFRKTLREMIGTADTAVGKLHLPAIATEPTAATLGAARN